VVDFERGASIFGTMAGMSAHAGVTNDVKWSLLFLIAACDVFAGGLIAVVWGILHPEPKIFSFTSEVFLLFFGAIMLVLDAPIPNERVKLVKDEIYKKMLFLTRFTGRGFWYMYLGTMIWAALWDQDLGGVFKVLGFVMSLYPILLGMAALAQGFRLSLRLQRLRKKILEAEPHMADGYQSMDKASFEQLCEKYKEVFSQNDLPYVINGLSLTAKNDGTVDVKEMKAWLSGPKDSVPTLI